MRITGTLLLVLSIGSTSVADESHLLIGSKPQTTISSIEHQNLLAALTPFKLSRPWDDLGQAQHWIRRNRGTAYHLQNLMNLKPHRTRLSGYYLELLKDKKQILETAKRLNRESDKNGLNSYRIDVLRFLVELISEGKQTFHSSQTKISEAYFSNAEGRSQLFQVLLPNDFSYQKKYPLLVQVFGSSSLVPTKDYPFIRINPTARGVWGYRSMSRYDVMQAISLMKLGYNIDEDRVYLTGTSAGATGMMHTAAYRQQSFAGLVPLVAFGNDLPLKNFRNLPLRCEHGVNDWTSSIGNVRVQFQKLKQLGYDAVLNEHPTAGHGIRKPPASTMDWLFQQKRNRRPEHIVYACEHPRDGKAYWLKIEAFQDPHTRAHIDAKSTGDGLTIQTDNIKQFSLDLTNAPIQTGQTLIIDDTRVKYKTTDGLKRLTLTKNPTWQITTTNKDKVPQPRPYGAGAAANLFQGEPLLVIYGTGADSKENQFLQAAAKVLARTGGPHFKSANVRFPVKPDSGLKQVPLDQYNLLLVGTPQNNSYLKKIASKLPFNIEKNTLNIAGRKPLPLEGAVLGLHFYNPEHPQRLIYIVSPYLNAAEQAQFLNNPRRFLSGSAGFKMIDQADLLVRGTDLRIRREMKFGSDWMFKNIRGRDQSIPSKYTDRVALAISHMQVMQNATQADFALWWGPEDKGSFGGYDFNWLSTFDTKFYTRADYAVRQRETECFTATVSGKELLDFNQRWISKNELITWPKVKQESIDPKHTYHIVLPMDLVVKLGSRKKILSNVAPGPDITPDQVAKQIFSTPPIR